ncbi:MAG TPA: PBP1A family penicillin-binding protein [Candidatus Angelobacter sp.]|nr:PBP1A family penicillin-binding protein [Candidatus Angelobacter sp.]
MAIKIKIPNAKGFRNSFRNPFIRAGLAVILILGLAFFGVFSYYYAKYQQIVDKRMRGQIFANTAKIYAQPRSIRIGQKADPQEIAGYLRHAGYTDVSAQAASKFGSYRLISGGIEIKPGEDSYYNSEGAVVRVRDTKVESIVSMRDANDTLSAYELEPQLLTGLFESQQRSKRRLVNYNDIPKVMVDAVTSIEDRRFFHHNGINYWRLVKAAWIDVREGGQRQGGSTITMQVARGFFLTREKRMDRKLKEIMISLELEQRFSKKQIFELYANQVDMGQRGSYAITGFGEAAQAYFGKDLKDINLQEAALLAGLIQRPSMLNPYRHAEKATERRNLVLEAMVETGDITRAQADTAKAAPLKLSPQNVEASDAPYFVDLIREQLLSKYSEDDLNEEGYRIYTTLDPSLQKVAAEAVDAGIHEVDDQIKRLRTRKVKIAKGKYETKVVAGPTPQVALVALDPHTGAVLALVGGRNYGTSQLNHAVAKRPTGSIFKPFVYATAVNNAITGEQPIFTPATLVDDSPTAFVNGDDVYTPRNYKGEFKGQVSAQYALQMSLNNATVKVAEMVGYDKVAALAHSAGIASVKATPAMALGAYDATPLEMAAAYTVFSNNGQRITPTMVTSVRDSNGDVLNNYQTQKTQVLDPRVAYVITSMMQAVINNGTAAGVRRLGFTAPAAGKTGSSHDAWFAGFTSNLLCIVWVGYDNYDDIHLSGGVLAAPVWAEFMKRAVALPAYSDVRSFNQPSGVVQVTLDKVTNEVATPTCPDDYVASFIEGTQPTQTCDQTSAERKNLFQKLFGLEPKPAPLVSNPSGGLNPSVPGSVSGSTTVNPQTVENPTDKPKKKGFFGRLFGSNREQNSDSREKEKVKPASPGQGAGPQ